MKRCQECGKKTTAFGIFRANNGKMVCQQCRHEIDYDDYGRPIPPKYINSLFGIVQIHRLPSSDKEGNTVREQKKDCYYFDMCRDRYGGFFDCKGCKVYSKYRGDY